GGQVSLTGRREEDDVVIEVRDTGVGIDPALLPKIFDLFTQGERSLARSQGGLGLGLTLVKHLVELHDGAIAAASAGHGKGSVFTVRLPATQPGADGALRGNHRPQASEARPLRLLVVDD